MDIDEGVKLVKDFWRDYLNSCPERRGTSCEKWDELKKVFGKGDILPLWVADMDFPTVPEVIKALKERTEHPIYGYTLYGNREREAECNWLKRRWKLDVNPDEIVYSPGVVDSIYYAIRAFTAPGDGVIVQTPVYGPFFNSVIKLGRKVIYNPLERCDSGWQMDCLGLETAFKSGAKMLILCNPHNPVGRAWRKDELEYVFKMADEYGAVVVVDEIHAEFSLNNSVIRGLACDYSEKLIVLESATKAFNLAGLRHSSIIVKDPKIRERMALEVELCHAEPNLFGAIAQTEAYEHGDQWMDAVIEYVRENRDFACRELNAMKGLKADIPDSTYLLWIDARGLDMNVEELSKFFVEKAGVGLNDGSSYGKEGTGYMRLNLATSRLILTEGIERIGRAIKGI